MNTQPLRLPQTAMPVQQHARKPRILVAGEFSAGKSTIINRLLGFDLLPENVTSTSLPPVWLVGEGSSAFTVDKNGAETPFQSWREIDLASTEYCVLSVDCPILRHVDLIDTPGNADPAIAAERWQRMLEFADMVLWCTPAAQAWRQSEKAVCQDLPDPLRENSMVLITQADRITSQTAQRRVLRRVQRDTRDLFPEVQIGSVLYDSHRDELRDRLITLAQGLQALPGSDFHPLGNAEPPMPELFAADAETAPQTPAAPIEIRRFSPRRIAAMRDVERAAAEGQESGVEELWSEHDPSQTANFDFERKPIAELPTERETPDSDQQSLTAEDQAAQIDLPNIAHDGAAEDVFGISDDAAAPSEDDDIIARVNAQVEPSKEDEAAPFDTSPEIETPELDDQIAELMAQELTSDSPMPEEEIEDQSAKDDTDTPPAAPTPSWASALWLEVSAGRAVYDPVELHACLNDFIAALNAMPMPGDAAAPTSAEEGA